MARHPFCWFLAATLVGIAQPAMAVVVDDFSNAQTAVIDPPGGATSVATAAAIGGRRGILANRLAGAGPVSGSVSAGVFNFSVMATTPDSRGQAVVTWDGDTDANVLSFFGTPQNLTTGGHRSFRVLVNSAGAGTEILLEVYTNAGSSSLAARRLPAVAAPTSFYLSYGPGADFVPRLGAGADFTSVGAIVMTVRGTETSAAIELVETVGPAVTATKTDLELDNDPIGATPQAPGTTFKHRVVISNPAAGEAVRVDLSDVNIDPNITLDPATANASVLAANDTYATSGNVALTVTAGANLYDCIPGNGAGLLDNDCDADLNDLGAPDANDLVVTTVGAIATTLGGSANVSADGSFTYTPPVGLGNAIDTFGYTVIDDDGSPGAMATVSIAVGPRIWFVDNAACGPAPCGSGTFASPFGSLVQADTASSAGDTIFVFTGSGPYPGGITLDARQTLHGQGVALVVDGQTLVAAGTRPVIANAAGAGVTVGADNTLQGFDVGATTTYDIAGSNFGTLTVSNVALSGGGGALDLDNGTLAATFGAVSVTSGVNGVDLDTVTGSLSIAGTTISGVSGTGIRVTNGGSTYSFGATSINAPVGLNLTTNATSTFSFASLAVTSTNGAGLLATTSGTLNIAGTGNTIGATNGPAVDLTSTTLGSGATFSSVSSATSGGKGINLDAVSGALAMNGGSITGAAGIAFDVNAGTGSISYGGTITNAASRAVEITGRTTSSVTLSGAISDGGTGVNVASNSGGTITLSGTYSGTAATSQIDVASNSGTAVVNFSGATKTLSTGGSNAIDITGNGTAQINFTGGGLAITTTSGIGFNATGGAGAISVQGSGNTITSTTGRALNVVSTTIGATGLTFRGISSNGAPNGIVLSGTGANAGLTVTGTGGDDSGGVIANSSGDGIQLSNTRSISLTEMAINSSGQSHIDGTSVIGLTLVGVDTDTSTAAALLGNGITNLSITGGTFHRGGAGAEPTCNVHGVDITNLLGTSSVTGATFTRSNTIQFRVRNTMASAAAPALPTDVLTVSGTTWATHNGPCSGDHLSVSTDTGGNFRLTVDASAGINTVNEGGLPATGGGIGVQAGASGSGTTHATVTGLKTTNNTAGVAFVATATANVRFRAFGNKPANGTGFSSTGSVAMILTCTTSGICEGSFDDNQITHTAGTGTNAMQVVVEGDGTGRMTVANNVVSGNFQRGLHGQSRSGTGSLSLLVTGNSFTQTDGNGLQVMNLEVGASGGGTTNSLCLNLASNTAVPAGGNSAYRLFHRTGYTYQLQNLVQASTTNTADVQTWVTTTKSNGGLPVSVSIGTSPFTTTAACTAPTLPTP